MASDTLSGIDVIVVDDEAQARDLIALLGGAGAEVRTGVSSQKGLALYRQRRPDLLLCDVEMEGGDGYALIRRIREIEKESNDRTPAIAVSTITRSADRLRAIAAGFQLHLVKPVDPAELVTAIADLVAAAAV